MLILRKHSNMLNRDILEGRMEKKMSASGKSEIEIQIDQQQLRCITPLEELVSLGDIRFLNASFNYLKSMEPFLSDCTQLVLLDLSINILSKIEHIEELPNLQVLNLSKNRLTEINIPLSLPNLKTLVKTHLPNS